MSAAGHTPGPWRVGETFGAIVADSPVSGIRGSDNVEAYGGHLIAESVAQKNRALIAAAPDLLAAANAALAYDRAIQACAGDPEKMSSFCTAQGDDLDALYFAWVDKSRAAVEKAQGAE